MVENEHNKNGKIFICYQGVGKSSTTNENNDFIDLESSNFKDRNGNRPDGWVDMYMNTAFDLASQGHKVFVSSHAEVRQRAAEMRDNYYPSISVAAVFPAISLKDEWIKRLGNRYANNSTLKNKLAFLNAQNRYSENIQEIKNDCDEFGFKKIEISETDYELINYLRD